MFWLPCPLNRKCTGRYFGSGAADSKLVPASPGPLAPLLANSPNSPPLHLPTQHYSPMLEGPSPHRIRIGHVRQIHSVACCRRYCARFSLTCSRATAVFADSTSSWLLREGPDPTRAGASSSTTCAFVPPNPERTDPRSPRLLPFAPTGAAPRSRKTDCSQSLSSGSPARNADDAGISSCCSASTVLIRPATPAAASRCPMFDLH